MLRFRCFSCARVYVCARACARAPQLSIPALWHLVAVFCAEHGRRSDASATPYSRLRSLVAPGWPHALRMPLAATTTCNVARSNAGSCNSSIAAAGGMVRVSRGAGAAGCVCRCKTGLCRRCIWRPATASAAVAVACMPLMQDTCRPRHAQHKHRMFSGGWVCISNPLERRATAAGRRKPTEPCPHAVCRPHVHTRWDGVTMIWVGLHAVRACHCRMLAKAGLLPYECMAAPTPPAPNPPAHPATPSSCEAHPLPHPAQPLG